VRAVDSGKVSITSRLLLDLSAAFDTVDHNILLSVLRDRFLPERDYITFGSLLSQIRLSVCLSSVCNAGAPYSGG